MTQQIKDENGYITIEKNPISRAGVFEYLGSSIGAPDPGKIYNVLRPAEELSDPECIASFRNLPIIDDHVMLGDSNDGLTPAEQKGIHGVTGGDVDFQNNVLYSNIKIFSETLKKLIESGKRGLSLGYRCKYEPASGTFAGKSYDYIQRSLRGNHLALVKEPRNDVHVLDSQFTFDTVDVHKTEEAKMTLDEAMKKIEELEGKMAKDLADKAAKDAEELAMKEKADKEAADKKAADEEKETKAMDAMDAEVKSLKEKVETLSKGGIKAVLGEVAKRDALAKQIAGQVGTFDHAEMTLDEVAAYGVEKLKLKAEKGQESAVLSGYLAAKEASTDARTASFDNSEAVKTSAVAAIMSARK